MDRFSINPRIYWVAFLLLIFFMQKLLLVDSRLWNTPISYTKSNKFYI